MNDAALRFGVDATDTGASHAFDFHALRGGALKLALSSSPQSIQAVHVYSAATAESLVENDPELAKIVIRGTKTGQDMGSLTELLSRASNFDMRAAQFI